MAKANPVAGFNLSAIPKGREDIAWEIVKLFARAGLGPAQQLAALANAIAESGLDPDAKSAPPEQSVGLFQLNRQGGLGTGFTAAQLKVPATNIEIVTKAAKKFSEFTKTTSAEEAVGMFTSKVIRPGNLEAQITARLKILQGLMETG